MSPSDGIRIGHMLEAAREALALAAGSQRSGLDHDRKLVLAVKLIAKLEKLPAE